jgi:hypothetical protein
LPGRQNWESKFVIFRRLTLSQEAEITTPRTGGGGILSHGETRQEIVEILGVISAASLFLLVLFTSIYALYPAVSRDFEGLPGDFPGMAFINSILSFAVYSINSIFTYVILTVCGIIAYYGAQHIEKIKDSPDGQEEPAEEGPAPEEPALTEPALAQGEEASPTQEEGTAPRHEEDIPREEPADPVREVQAEARKEPGNEESREEPPASADEAAPPDAPEVAGTEDAPGDGAEDSQPEEAEPAPALKSSPAPVGQIDKEIIREIKREA